MYERPSWFSFHFITSSSSIDIYHTLILNELMNYFNVERSTKENENHSIPRGHKRQKSSTRTKVQRFNLDSNIYIYIHVTKKLKLFIARVFKRSIEVECVHGLNGVSARQNVVYRSNCIDDLVDFTQREGEREKETERSKKLENVRR